jgi:dihydrofolate reductase
MPTPPFTITIHMVSSLDGFIAKKDNDISWFETADHYEQGLTVSDQDAADFLKTIDCYLMGSHTYQHALHLSETYGWPYGDVPTIVLSHRNLPVTRPNVQVCAAADLQQFINQRLKPQYSNVWLVGGVMLARQFLSSNLAHQIRLSILPIILGDGLPFLDHIGREQPLHLKSVTPYKSGMVELHYEIKK